MVNKRINKRWVQQAAAQMQRHMSGTQPYTQRLFLLLINSCQCTPLSPKQLNILQKAVGEDAAALDAADKKFSKRDARFS